MKEDVQTLYARILEDIRAEMDEAETIYLNLCGTAMSCLVRMEIADPALSGCRIEQLSSQYREKLQLIIRELSMVYRNPIRVFPFPDDSTMLDALETYNAQFEELERILDQLCKENSIPKNNQPTKIQVQNRSIWKSIMNSIDLKKEFKNQFDETASNIDRSKSPAAGYPGCKKHHNSRKVPTMNLRPNILICGTSRYTNTDLFSEATPAGTIPENSENDDAGEDIGPDGNPEGLIRRHVETPVARFFEANEITDLGEEGEIPENLSMADYVKLIEADLRSNGLLGDDAKIDVVWFCATETAFMMESEKDFIRSAAGFPNALVVANPIISSNRAEFKREIDALTGLAGIRRIVLAPNASSGMSFSTLSSGTQYLVEKTKRLYLDDVDAPDMEKEAFEAAWTEFYGEKLEEWRNSREGTLSDCIGIAAGRANFILNSPKDVSLTDLVEEGIDLLAELVDILRGNDVEEDRPGKTDLAHTAELKNNIELMIYEIAACFGRAASPQSVETILRHSKASRLPKDAAAVTYAVAQVAKAFFVPEPEYSSKDLLRIYREAMDEALEMEFRPYDDENPFADSDDDFELDEEDCGDGGEPGGDSGDVHEPEDELPDDCRADYGKKHGGKKQKKSKK